MGMGFVAIAAALFSYQEQQTEKRARRKEERVRRQIEASKRQRASLKAQREARRKRATLVAAAEAQGAGATSALETALGSITSQTAAGVGFAGAVGELQEQVFQAQGEQADARGKAQVFSTVATVFGGGV